MAVKAAGARAIREISIKVGTDDYVKHVAAVRITNNTKAVTFKGGAPDALLVDTSAPEYMLELNVVHDYDTVGSLYNYLVTNAGQTATFIYKPIAGGTFQATVTAAIVMPTIGGDIDKFATETIKMPCSKPTVVQPV